MLRIPCPFCGTRDETEFRFGGESVEAPAVDADDAQWADYLFNRDNSKGLQQERWCHDYGCGRWFKLVRDTVSHKILASCEMGEEASPSAPLERNEGPPE